MRRTEVESLFLQRFGALYAQFGFRGLRRFPARVRAPYSFALRLVFGRAETQLDLLCVTLTEGHPGNVKRFLQRIEQAPPLEGDESKGLPVLVAPFLGQEAQGLCREAGVGFFDLAGNAGLDVPGLYVDILGRSSKLPRKREVLTPFGGKAERVVRRLLFKPDKRWKMRELAEAADISLGLASMATSALAKEGLLVKSRAGVQLPDPSRLLDAWGSAYDLRGSRMHIYRSFDDVPALVRRLARLYENFGNKYALTLWTAAHELFQDTEPPPHLALYWTGEQEALAKALHLMEDVGRSYVFVFTPYDESLLWGASSTEKRLRIVHPLQLYLDLGSGNENELRLAQRVREQVITW